MLGFHQKGLEEFRKQGSGLLVVGRGMGDWRLVVSTLAELSSTKSLVLVLNVAAKFSGNHQALCLIELCEWWAMMSKSPPQVLDKDTLSAKRQGMYQQGGMFIVTSRILAADVLTGAIAKCSNLAGILVLNAHQVEEMDNVAFCLRMILKQHPKAFVRAVSDSAQSIASKGLLVLLKSLQIKRVFLYPRFRQETKEELDLQGPEMIEIAQPLSDLAREIQSQLIKSLGQCVDAIKANSSLDTTELSVETVLFKAYDGNLRRRLDGIWHTLPNKTRKAVEELTVFKELIRDVAKLDSVSFYEKLIGLKLAWQQEDKDMRSMWMLSNSADRVFTSARNRLYTISDTKQLELVLEPNLKLQELRQVLEEINGEFESATVFGGAKVVVLVRDLVSLSQVTAGLSSPSQLKRKFWGFLKTHLGSISDPDLVLANELRQLEVWRETLDEDFKSRVGFKDTNFQPDNVYQSGNNVTVLSNSLVAVHLLSDVKRLGLFDLLQPKYIVVYEPDVGVMREIECYHALVRKLPCGGGGVRCYWLYYQHSFEEQANESYLNQERDGFLRLIQQKAELVFAEEEEQAILDEETAKRLRVKGPCPKVVVDLREFNAILLNVLDLAGFELDPRTLQVGDYILSPDICLERKSIPDLVSSFNDGRLLHQCQLMTRHYKKPVLLLEFPENGPFRLNSPQLASRLVLLCLHFPHLGVVWAKNVRCAVDLFAEMQRNQLPPNGDKAEAVLAADSAAIKPSNEVDNHQAFDLLLQLPGVTRENAYRVARNANSLADLCKLSLKQLVENVFGEEDKPNAKLLFDFLQQDGSWVE
ncbi:hypothetical protein BASA81_011120 [Batrachochytrium salamandrivorans]|nr:hypothetical protein BASA81_011120 [Batrachochytrium salamandrivorans]